MKKLIMIFAVLILFAGIVFAVPPPSEPFHQTLYVNQIEPYSGDGIGYGRRVNSGADGDFIVSRGDNSDGSTKMTIESRNDAITKSRAEIGLRAWVPSTSKWQEWNIRSHGEFYGAGKSGFGISEYLYNGDMSSAGGPWGTIRFYIEDGTGNVGIGTSSPLGPLHVVDTGTYANGILIERLGDSPRIGFIQTSATEGAATAPVWYIDNQNDRFRILRQPDYQTSGSEFVTVKSDGKVGIGTDAPTEKLEVAGTIKATSFVDGSGNVIGGGGGDGSLIHVSADSSSAAVTSHGVVIDSGDVANNARIEIRDTDGTGNTPYIDFADDSTSDFDLRMILAGNIFKFQHGTDYNSKDLVIDLTTGNVGIGTASPVKRLHVYGAGTLDAKSTDGKVLIESPSFFNGQLQIKNTESPGTHDETSIGFIGKDNRFWVIGAGATTGLVSDKFGIGYGTGDPDNDGAGNILTIKNTGEVGIGTQSPSEKLEVAGNVKATAFCVGGNCVTDLSAAGGTGEWSKTGTDISYNAGNVGIGTTSPEMCPGCTAKALEIEGDNAGVAFDDTSSGSKFFVFSNDNQLRMAAEGASLPSQYMVMTTDGNVGIGTTSPTVKFEVDGTIKATSFVDGSGNALGVTGGGSDLTLVTETATPSQVSVGAAGGNTELNIHGDIISAKSGGSLSLTGSGGPAVVMYVDGSKTVLDSPSGGTGIGLAIAGNDKLYVSNSGLVGINNPTPGEVLDVGGKVKANEFKLATGVKLYSTNNDDLMLAANAGGYIKPMSDLMLMGKNLILDGVSDVDVRSGNIEAKKNGGRGGDVKGVRLCIGADCKASWDEVAPAAVGGSGDVTGDGGLSGLDSAYVMQYLAGGRTFSTEEYARADINGDGRIDTLDADLIAQVSTGVITLDEAHHSVGKFRADSAFNVNYDGEVSIGGTIVAGQGAYPGDYPVWMTNKGGTIVARKTGAAGAKSIGFGGIAGYREEILQTEENEDYGRQNSYGVFGFAKTTSTDPDGAPLVTGKARGVVGRALNVGGSTDRRAAVGIKGVVGVADAQPGGAGIGVFGRAQGANQYAAYFSGGLGVYVKGDLMSRRFKGIELLEVPPGCVGKLGDLTGDGNVDTADVDQYRIWIKEELIADGTVTYANNKCADVNVNQKLGLGDLKLVSTLNRSVIDQAYLADKRILTIGDENTVLEIKGPKIDDNNPSNGYGLFYPFPMKIENSVKIAGSLGVNSISGKSRQKTKVAGIVGGCPTNKLFGNYDDTGLVTSEDIREIRAIARTGRNRAGQRMRQIPGWGGLNFKRNERFQCMDINGNGRIDMDDVAKAIEIKEAGIMYASGGFSSIGDGQAAKSDEFRYKIGLKIGGQLDVGGGITVRGVKQRSIGVFVGKTPCTFMGDLMTPYGCAASKKFDTDDIPNSLKGYARAKAICNYYFPRTDSRMCTGTDMAIAMMNDDDMNRNNEFLPKGWYSAGLVANAGSHDSGRHDCYGWTYSEDTYDAAPMWKPQTGKDNGRPSWNYCSSKQNILCCAN